ncbi:MAG TPA: hypothetical protein VMG10_00205 [Gemmataceae bacterium]|nr:hypothetical protein [Gemmataceae bacterium]
MPDTPIASLYLPLLAEGKPIFTSEQCDVLGDLFHTRFAGFSATSVEGSPPWYGFWLPPGTVKPVIDRHMLFVNYTPQVEEAKTFFRYLKSILELKEVPKPHTATSDEQTTLLPGHPLGRSGSTDRRGRTGQQQFRVRSSFHWPTDRDPIFSS